MTSIEHVQKPNQSINLKSKLESLELKLAKAVLLLEELQIEALEVHSVCSHFLATDITKSDNSVDLIDRFLKDKRK